MGKYDFSVIMSVYKSDNPEQLDVALDSIINQTLPPNEIIVVVDGPVPNALSNTLEDKKNYISTVKDIVSGAKYWVRRSFTYSC